MESVQTKGSITVEVIVMLSLIGTMTPILYKHISERREDIDNINQANTLLLLKNASLEYIEANQNIMDTGTVVLTPMDIGIDLSGYLIGIRKDSDGSINTMIAGTPSNDLKAAKIASLLGVSAGIYSAQDKTKAWGINGVWAENIANYGFSSLPTGIPVVTSAYDKEKNVNLNEEQLKDFLENTVFEKVTAKLFCIENPEIPEEQKCIDKWQFDKCSELIALCDDKTKCNDAYNKRCNQTCNDILISYRIEGSLPLSNTSFRLTGTNPNGENDKTTCYFTANKGLNAIEVIEACNNGDLEACDLAQKYNLNSTCQKIMDTYQNLLKTPKNDIYTLSSGIKTSCWFKDSYGFSSKEIIDKCNDGTTIACQIGNENKLNRTCAELQNTMKSYGDNPSNGSFKLTLNNSAGSFFLCDMTQNPPWTQVFISSTEGAFYSAPYKATYGFACAGGAGNTEKISLGGTSGGKGGIVLGSDTFSSGTIFKIAIKKGGPVWSNSNVQSGGSGIGIYIGSNYALNNLKIVAGGGGGAHGDGGGSGWGGGGSNTVNAPKGQGFGFYADAKGSIGQAGGGNGGCPTYPGIPYGGDGSGCITSSNDPGAGGGSGFCSLNVCKEVLPYGINQKIPYKPTSVSKPVVDPEAAIYLIEIKE